MRETKGTSEIRGHIAPAKVALGYLAAGTAYIFLSDHVTATLFGDRALTIGTWKGAAFILISAAILYLLLRRSANLTEAVTRRLVESERSARRLFLQNPEAMWLYDPESHAFIDVNEAALSRYGWSRDEFLRMRASDLEIAGEPGLPTAGSPSDHPAEYIVRHRTRDGRILKVAIGSHRIRREDRPAILAVARDLTGLAAAEDALRAREADLEDLTGRLTERVKEMQCLHAVLSLCNEAGKPIDELMDAVAAELPAALRYPDLAAARLTLAGRRYSADPFPGDGPAIRRSIPGADPTGLLELAYRTPPRGDHEAPFLPEEESLADIVAAELGQMIERRRIATTLRLHDRGLAAVPAGICIAEASGTDRPISYVNPAFLKISGYPENEVIGRDCRFLQGPETDGTTKRRIREALQAGSSFSGEVLNYRRSGEAFWNDLLISPIHDASGRVTHFVGVMRDVSQRHVVQERIRLLESAVEAAASAIVITDDKGRIEYVNSAFQRMTGYAGDEVAGQTLRFLKSESHDPAFFETLWQTILAGDVWRSPIVNRRKDGTNYRASQTIAPIRDDRGRIAHFVAIQEDTTALHEAEEQLRHAQRLQAVGQLTGGIAHDFNNILAVVLGNLELLDEQVSDEDLRELIADPLAATARGSELTRRLLAFARLQPLMPRGVRIEALINRVEDLLRPALTEAIEVRTRHEPGLWHAFADEGQLETALLNIALNARDAMPQGGSLLIETANAKLDDDYAAFNHEVRSGDYVMIAISDTGAGMPPDVLAKAFEPFFTTKLKGHSSGLGLSMVYGFAKQSGGHVGIYSEVDRGTTVRLYLPRAVDGSEPAEEVRQHRMDGKGKKILVVEDDEGVARWIVRALESANFRVQVATTAAEAAGRVADGGEPDLILSDIVLPGGTTGVQLASDLAERGCAAKFLFMSGYTRDAVSRDGPLDPQAPLLTKPFRRAELLRQVGALLGEGEQGEWE